MARNEEFKLKNDRYSSIRGEAHLLDMFCAKCNTLLMKYQKDGKGMLYRCYLNRIFHPPELEKLQYFYNAANMKVVPNLACKKCSTIIGTPMVYDDGRVAFRLIKGRYAKKRVL